MHLVLLTKLELILIENKQHLLVEVLSQVIFKECFLHGGPALTPVHLLSLKHLVELLLASVKQKLLKVHFSILGIIKLLKKSYAQLDIEVKEGSLSRALHENDLH